MQMLSFDWFVYSLSIAQLVASFWCIFVSSKTIQVKQNDLKINYLSQIVLNQLDLNFYALIVDSVVTI